MNNPLVSIITPVYNGDKYISNAIDSVLAQTYKNFELIIINDGSTDNSFNIINTYLSDTRVRYFEQNNSGVSAARNTAIEHSKGEFIGFLDQDDLWHPEKLEIQVNFLKKHPEVSLVYSDYTILNELKNQSYRLSDAASFDSSRCDVNSILTRNPIGILTVLINKKCLIDAGPLNTRLKGTDDYELWLILALDYKFQFIPQSLATYRWHGENVSNDDLKMMIEESKAICSFLSKRPDAYNKLDKSIVKSKLFNNYLKIGDLYIWLYKDRINARYFYFNALKQTPKNIKTFNKYLKTFINEDLSRFISWQWKKIIK